MAVLDQGGEDRLNIPYTRWPLQQTRYERLYLGADQYLQPAPAAKAVESRYPATPVRARSPTGSQKRPS